MWRKRRGSGRFGSIDTGASAIRGDLNCDRVVNFGNINPFVTALTGGEDAYYDAWPDCHWYNGDINADGTYGQGSFGDINPFVALLTGGG